MSSTALNRVIDSLLIGKNAKRNSFLFGLAVFVVESSLLLIGAYIDDSFYMQNGGRGLFQLYSIWGILFGDIFLLYILSLLIAEINILDRKTPIIQSIKYRRYLRNCKKQLIDFLSIRKGQKLFFYIVGVGLLFWVNNAYQTLYPEKYYGNDLYDSIYHPTGYVAIRIVFLSSWTIFVPYLAYSALIISVSLWKIFKRLKSNNALNFNIYHPDLCGGFSYLGNINVYFILGIFIVYMQLSITLATHHKLNPGLFLGFVVATILFVMATFFITIPINLYLREEKTRVKMSNYKKIMQKNRVLDVLAQYLTIEKVSFSPYPLPQKVFILVARAAPIVVGVARFFPR